MIVWWRVYKCIFFVLQELAEREAEVAQMQGVTKELENRLGASLSAEARERDLREAAEAGRDRAVKVKNIAQTDIILISL